MSARPIGAAAQRPEEIEAERTRAGLALGVDAPIGNILATVEDLAGIPVTVAELPEQIAGMYIRRREQPFIFVNGTHSPVRQRFTLAHELGHHMLNHRQRVDATQDLFGAPKDPDEVAANYFAGAFLVPRTALRNWVDHHPDHAGDLELVVRAGAYFGVSPMVARIRLERAGVLRKAESARIKEQIRNQEHYGLISYLGVSPLHDELSRLHARGEFPRLPASMTTAARRAHDAGLIDDDKFAEVLQGRTELSQVSDDD